MKTRELLMANKVEGNKNYKTQVNNLIYTKKDAI